MREDRGFGAGSFVVESDVRYYQRRVCLERTAAARALTAEARARRMQLVEMYTAKLAALGA